MLVKRTYVMQYQSKVAQTYHFPFRFQVCFVAWKTLRVFIVLDCDLRLWITESGEREKRER